MSTESFPQQILRIWQIRLGMVGIRHWAMSIGQIQLGMASIGAWAVANAKGCSCVGICLVTFALARTMTN